MNMLKRIRKWWNNPEPCPVCRRPFVERILPGKERRYRNADKKELRIAYSFYIGAIITGLVFTAVFYFAIVRPFFGNDFYLYLGSIFFSLGSGALLTHLLYKSSYYTNRAFEVKCQ
jgi:hypothetical protein